MSVIALLPPQRAGFLVAGGFAAVAALLFPGYALGLIAFSVPFGGALRVPVGDLSLTATELTVGLLGVAWFARATTRQRLDIRAPGVWLFLAAFLGIATLSMADAPSLSLTIKELVKWLEFGLVVTLAASLPQSTRELGVVLGALLLAGTAEALYGLSQAMRGAGPAGFFLDEGVLRAFGSFGQPNPFAAYLTTILVLAIGVGIALLTYARSRFWAPFALLLLVSGTVMFLAITASLSRSAWIALTVGAVVMIMAHQRRALPYLAGAALVGTLLWLLGLVPPLITSRFTVLLENFALFDAQAVTLTATNFPLVQRMAIWQAAWDMFQDHPLLGVGLGNFDTAYLVYALPGWPELPGHAHNYYLNLLAEVGLLGLGAYLALLTSFLAYTVRALRRVRTLVAGDPGNRELPLLYGVALGTLGLLAVLTVHHLFDNLFVHGMAAQVGLMLGLCLATPALAAASAKRETTSG